MEFLNTGRAMGSFSVPGSPSVSRIIADSNTASYPIDYIGCLSEYPKTAFITTSETTWLWQHNINTHVSPSSHSCSLVEFRKKKTTWLRLGKHCGLGSNHYITSETSVTTVPTLLEQLKLCMGHNFTTY